MFNAIETFDFWKDLKGTALSGDVDGFVSMLGQRFGELERVSDELRVLYYIALNCERWAYASALDLYSRKSRVFLDVQTERLCALHDALAAASKFIGNGSHQYLVLELDAVLARHFIKLK